MPGRDERVLVLWPHYFDAELSRREGRRVPKDLAVEKPRVQDVAKAARSIGGKVTLDDAAKPPRFWDQRKGRVLVEGAEDSKEEVLKQVARRL